MAIKKYINTTEAAELTGCSRNEIINLAKTGVLPSHRTRRGHYRLNVDAVEAYFGIQINKPTVVVDKPAPIVKTRAPKVEPRYVEVVTEPVPINTCNIRRNTPHYKREPLSGGHTKDLCGKIIH